jgi:hypothetical protein
VIRRGAKYVNIVLKGTTRAKTTKGKSWSGCCCRHRRAPSDLLDHQRRMQRESQSLASVEPTYQPTRPRGLPPDVCIHIPHHLLRLRQKKATEVTTSKESFILLFTVICTRIMARFRSLFLSNSGRQHVPDLAICFLNGQTYDKSPTVSLIELGKTHLLVLDTLS